MSNFKLELQRIDNQLKIEAKNHGESDDPLYLALVGFALTLDDKELHDAERLLLKATTEMALSPKYEDRKNAFIAAVMSVSDGLGDAEFAITIAAKDGDVEYELEQNQSPSVIPFMVEALLHAAHNFESDQDKEMLEGFATIAARKAKENLMDEFLTHFNGGNEQCIH